MSEARAICGQCNWRGLVQVKPDWPMGMQSCPRCGRRMLGYAPEMPIFRSYGAEPLDGLLRIE